MWKVYLFLYLLQLCSIRSGLILCGLILIFVLLVGLLMLAVANPDLLFDFDETDDGVKKSLKVIHKTLVHASITVLLLSLIPCKRVVALSVGLYFGNQAVQTVIKDEKVQKVSDIINLYLDKTMQDLQGEIKK